MILDKRELYRISKSKTTVGFGAGVTAEKTLHIVQDAFDYYVDNDKDLWGTTFEGKPVYPPEKLLEEDRDNLFIVICTTFFEEMVEQLKGMGFELGRHVAYTPLLHTVIANMRLDRGSTKLLMSGYGAGGGIYTVNSRTGEVTLLHEGQYRGMYRLGDDIFVLQERDGIHRLDANTLEIVERYNFPTFRNALGIDYCEQRDRFYVTLSHRDEIAVIDHASMTQVGTLDLFAGKYAATNKEQHHINDLLVVDEGRRLIVSMFSLAGYWRKNVYDGTVVEVDIDRNEISGILMSGLVKPHTIRFFEDDLFLLDSFRGRMYRGSDNVMAEFSGFIRGLERDSERYYIGLSRNRHIEESYRLNRPMMTNPGLMVYLAEERVFKFIELPLSDPYGIMDLAKDGE